MSSAHLPSHVHGAARAVAEEDGHIPDEQVVWALRFIPRPCANASKITDHVWLGGASALADMGRMAEMNVKCESCVCGARWLLFARPWLSACCPPPLPPRFLHSCADCYEWRGCEQVTSPRRSTLGIPEV